MVDVIIIYGPTAVGKSDIAIELAKKINGEIISADSIQIYKKLNVGSAKVTKEEMQDIKHYLIDVCEPEDNFSVADFCDLAKKYINTIIENGKVPIIVGGTGLYLKSLINGYDFAGINKNEEFREKLNNLTTEQIYEEILKLDSSIQIDKNNKHRLIRKLETLTFNGEIKNNNSFNYSYKIFAICDDRQEIYNRINKRVDKMVEKGLLIELKNLLDSGLTEDNQSMKAIAYKELIPYIKNEKSLQECLDILKQKSRNYAKRQFTFMNQFENLIKVDFKGIKETSELIYELIMENNNG